MGNRATIRWRMIDDDPHPSDETPQREVKNLIGWRKMKVLPVGLLVSPLREGGMTSTLSEEAVCDQRPKHDAPEGDCGPPGCGWYAFYEAKNLYGGRSEPFRKDEAIVEVSAVGKTWLHDKGFRSKQIRMESIWVPAGTESGLCQTLHEMYELPVYEIPGEEETEEDEIRATGAYSDASIKLAKEIAQGGFPWTLEKRKSSSPPARPNEPSGKSPLTSDQGLQQKREWEDLLHGRPSRYGSAADKARAEYDLACARENLNRALGKCAFCSNQDPHTHGIDDLKGDS